jgi:hypothetical protein
MKLKEHVPPDAVQVAEMCRCMSDYLEAHTNDYVVLPRVVKWAGPFVAVASAVLALEVPAFHAPVVLAV